MVSMNIISKTSSNLLDPSQHTILDDAEIREREFGSKMVLVVEQMQCITIWLVKACLLLMYHRLTYVVPSTRNSLSRFVGKADRCFTGYRMSLRQNLAVKILAGYVAVSFVVMEILCRWNSAWCQVSGGVLG